LSEPEVEKALKTYPQKLIFTSTERSKMAQKILLDSDFLIALYKPTDSSHQKAKSLASKYFKTHEFLVLNLVIFESVTVLSYQIGMSEAKKFYLNLQDFIHAVINFDDNLEKKTWGIFLKQEKKGASFIDCANLTLLMEYNLSGILSFDRFYHNKRFNG